ncbi:hypothetical protein C7475_1049 [Chitinophaga sp. S165]|nr:hypothetical protein C7475_1049 [Chitinophaga sp. S165]
MIGNKLIIALVHIFLWLFLSLGYLFLSEPITVYMCPGYHNVTIWLMVLSAGLTLIFIATAISLIVSFRIVKKRRLKSLVTA